MSINYNTIRFIAIIVLALSIVGINLYGGNVQTSTLVKVVDGDTIKLKDNKGNVVRYRLAGIDTPESYLNKKARKDIKSCDIIYYKYLHLGLTAKEYLMDRYSIGDKITYTVVDTGYYKRPVIYIQWLNKTIIKNGLGIVKDYGNLSKDELSELYKLESEAMSKHIGIWRYLKTKCY